ncbi:MAG: class I SAM-dependent methyltransferase [Rhodoferax sp.]
MSDWSAGYVADIGYTYGYYPELNPLRVKLAFLNNGLSVPEFGNACELGFGQGLATNLHAAATVTHWYGTDFNPSQAAFAQELANASGASAQLYDEAFADFAQRPDLPEFDYIGLHGIWSWISDDNRAVIVDFIRRKLKVGGVLYISYNTQPGWATFAPIRHLMTEHAQVMGAPGQGIVPRIDGALDFADKLLATNPMYARANPQVAERTRKLKGQNRQYLAHEYFNRDWHPMHFATMAQWLEPAKVQFACSANYIDHVEVLNLTPEQQTLISEIPDPMFAQTVRDFMVNQVFRRDYWVKGLRKISPLEQGEQARAQRIILVTPRADVSLKVTGALGEASMSDAIYGPLLDYLADHKIRTIAQIEHALKGQQLYFSQVMQAIMVLAGAGHLAPVQDDAIITKARKLSDKLNAHLMAKSRASGDVLYLTSPVTGGGVAVGRFAQLFMHLHLQHKTPPAQWPEQAWALIKGQSQKLLKDGQTLTTDEDNLAELAEQAKHFVDKQWPLLKALHVM